MNDFKTQQFARFFIKDIKSQSSKSDSGSSSFNSLDIINSNEIKISSN